MGYERFSSEDINKIVGLVDESARNKLKEDVADLVGQQIDDILNQRPLSFNKELGMLLKSDMPTVSFRRETIQQIFNMFHEVIRDREKYQSLTWKTGIKIGANFCMDLMKFFTNIKQIPRSYDVFLDFWARFDSTAGWGLISIKRFDLEKMSLQIEVQNSFLVGDSDNHIHCPFVGGYIFGILGIGFDFVFKILERNEYLPPNKRLIPKAFEEKSGSKCVFIFTFDEVKFKNSFDKFFEALFAHLEDDDNAAVRSLRSSIEFIAKEKLDVPLKEQTSFFRLLKVFKDLNIQEIDYKEIERAHAILSEILHGIRKHFNKTLVSELIEISHDFILKVEKLTLSKGQITDAKEYLEMGPQTRKEVQEELKHLNALLEMHQKQLRILEIDLAKYGPGEKPVHKQTQWMEVKDQIGQIKKRINEIKKGKK